MYFVLIRSSGSGISWKRPNLKQIIVLIDATSMPCFLHLLQPQGWTQHQGWHPWASDASLSCVVFYGGMFIWWYTLSSTQFDNQEWRVEMWQHYKSFLCIPQMASINRMETSKGKYLPVPGQCMQFILIIFVDQWMSTIRGHCHDSWLPFHSRASRFRGARPLSGRWDVAVPSSYLQQTRHVQCSNTFTNGVWLAYLVRTLIQLQLAIFCTSHPEHLAQAGKAMLWLHAMH